MAFIKKIIPLPGPGTLAPASADRHVLLKAFLYTLALVHVLLAILWSYTDIELYRAYTTEDGYIELTTAFLLLMTSFWCLYKALSGKRRIPVVFFSVAALVFFFGFGEEISWGQRILGFDTPEELQKINNQNEFSLHNIQIRDISLNRLIFSAGLYTGAFLYFLAFPALYRRNAWFRNLVDKIALPIPTTTQSLLYLLSFFSLLLIEQDRKWEVQEFVLACFIFFAFLLPCNRSSAKQD
ncbi:hypothetical protein OB13_18980 [Pontibacter sp. HJ8]